MIVPNTTPRTTRSVLIQLINDRLTAKLIYENIKLQTLALHITTLEQSNNKYEQCTSNQTILQRGVFISLTLTLTPPKPTLGVTVRTAPSPLIWLHRHRSRQQGPHPLSCLGAGGWGQPGRQREGGSKTKKISMKNMGLAENSLL